MMAYFEIMEKNGELKAVYSKSDFDYMVRQGWKRHIQTNSVTIEPLREAKVKGKPGRKPKNPNLGGSNGNSSDSNKP